MDRGEYMNKDHCLECRCKLYLPVALLFFRELNFRRSQNSSLSTKLFPHTSSQISDSAPEQQYRVPRFLVLESVLAKSIFFDPGVINIPCQSISFEYIPLLESFVPRILVNNSTTLNSSSIEPELIFAFVLFTRWNQPVVLNT